MDKMNSLLRSFKFFNAKIGVLNVQRCKEIFPWPPCTGVPKEMLASLLPYYNILLSLIFVRYYMLQWSINDYVLYDDILYGMSPNTTVQGARGR